MEQATKDGMIALGFRHAFILEQVSPKLLKRIIDLNHVAEYKQGLIKGRDRYIEDKEMILTAKKKQQTRQAKLDKIKAQNKEQEKDEKER